MKPEYPRECLAQGVSENNIIKTYANISNQCYNKEGLHATSDVLGSNVQIFIGDRKTSIGPELRCKCEISHDQKLTFEKILGD